MTQILDRSKPYGMLFLGPKKYYGQDGCGFDMETGELVVDLRTPHVPAGPSTEPESAAGAADSPIVESQSESEPDTYQLTCRLCNRAFVYHDDIDQVRAFRAMKGHLFMVHKIRMPKKGESNE